MFSNTKPAKWRPTAGKSTPPCYRYTRREYFNLLKERVDRYSRMKAVNAPAIIVKHNRKMVLRAALASVFPCIETRLRSYDEQRFLDTLCAKRNGWAWCKLQEGHDSNCIYTWDGVVDIMLLAVEKARTMNEVNQTKQEAR